MPLIILAHFQVRMEKHHSNALEIAKYLECHPCIDKVLHPLLKSNPSKETAQSQNKGMHSGVFSFYMKGSATRQANAIHECYTFI